MGYIMKGHTLPGIKQRKTDPDAPGTPGTPGYESEVKSTDYLTKTPSIVASKSAKEDYEGTDGSNDSEEDNDKETARTNTPPNTRPPMFSDADTHKKVKKKLSE
jgi:hypothetical protein